MTELIGGLTDATASAVTKAPKTAKRKAGPGAPKPRVAASETKAANKASKAKKAPNAAPGAKGAGVAQAKGARQGGKTDRILGLLKQPGGATLSQIMKAAGWQAHSVRGFISGTLGKKMGLTVVSTRTGDGARNYSIKA